MTGTNRGYSGETWATSQTQFGDHWASCWPRLVHRSGTLGRAFGQVSGTRRGRLGKTWTTLRGRVGDIWARLGQRLEHESGLVWRTSRQRQRNNDREKENKTQQLHLKAERPHSRRYVLCVRPKTAKVEARRDRNKKTQ